MYLCIRILFFQIILFLNILLTGIAAAPLTEDEHPWGRVGIGSSIVTQTTVITNAAESPVISVQKIETTLVAADNDSITLQEAETIEMGNKTVKKEPQTKCYDFWQEPLIGGVRIKIGEPVKLIIDKKTVPCEVRIYEQTVQGGTKTTTVWWNSSFFPYVLRTERVLRGMPAAEAAGSLGEIISQSVTVVKEVSGAKSHRYYKLQTTEQSGKITKRTDTVCSRNIPGGLRSSTTLEADDTGKTIRSSTTRLTSYSYSFSP
jgi:hypothetical protein